MLIEHGNAFYCEKCKFKTGGVPPTETKKYWHCVRCGSNLTQTAATVRVEIKSESGTSNDPAKILVYENDLLIAEIIARVELKPGADGGLYHCVTLVQQSTA